MPIEDPNELERVDREIRLNELKERPETIDAHLSDDCPPEAAGGFVDYVEQFENASWTTHIEQLARAGFELPPPDQLEDAALGQKLWELIEKLAELRVFLSCTDHLSDRELYTLLCDDVLLEETKDLVLDDASACHIDLVSSGSEEDIAIWLKHYADEETRRHWLEDFPDDEIPPHQDPAYDRDRTLPQVTYGPPELPDECEEA